MSGEESDRPGLTLELPCKEMDPPGLLRPQSSTLPLRTFLAAALAQGLCEVLLVVTKEVEEAGCWLHTS